jgi:hypothetical protein
MRKLAALLISAAALVTISACADTYGPGYGVASSERYNDGYYDGYYGQPIGGYWASDGYYYYRPATGQPYVRDDSRHFRRDQGDGFQPFHMRDWGDH